MNDVHAEGQLMVRPSVFAACGAVGIVIKRTVDDSALSLYSWSEPRGAKDGGGADDQSVFHWLVDSNGKIRVCSAES